jgi:RNA polymerase sigma-70 factor (ECF subfamily)
VTPRPQNGTYTEASDDALVVAALIGDLAAFDEIVRRFRGAVTQVALQQLGGADRARAEDVAQETFLLAFKALPQLGDPTRFAPWLHAIARNRARRVGDQDRRAAPTEPTEMDRLLIASSPSLSQTAADEAASGLADRLIEALGALAPEYRTPLRLFYFDEWPVARIAGFLSLPVTTVKWRLHQGRALLRSRLARPEAAENHAEENRHDPEQRHRRKGGTATPATPVARNQRPRPARQPDGQPVTGREERRAAL